MAGKLWCLFVSMVNYFCGLQAGDKANVLHTINMYVMSIHTIISLCAWKWSFWENFKHLASSWDGFFFYLRSTLTATLMKMLLRSDLGKKKLNQKMKLLIFWSVYVPTLTYGQIWVLSQRVTFWIQTAEMSFFWGVPGSSLELRWEALSTGVDLLLPHWKAEDASWMLSSGDIPGTSHRQEILGKIQNLLHILCIPFSQVMPQGLPGGPGQLCWGE